MDKDVSTDRFQGLTSALLKVKCRVRARILGPG